MIERNADATGAALEVEHLAKSYGETVALADVTLEVRTGEVFGLLGPNGAGKTTLIRIVMDIIRADAGSVRVFGEPFRRPLLDRIGYLPEERGLYRKQTVQEVMTYFGHLRGMSRADARERALQWLERVELGEVASWKVEQLSKGMSQKVQIASTLMIEPDLCILDEPFSGLDPVNIRLVRDLIGQRREQGRTTILSTHLMNMVEALCDRAGLIHDGHLLAYGGVDELRREHSPPVVRLSAAEAPSDVAGVVSIEEGEGGYRLLLEETAAPEEVLRALVEAGCPVRRFEPMLASMDQVFLRLVRKEAA